MSAGGEAPVFVYSDIEIPYPQRSAKQPAGKFDKFYLKGSLEHWIDFCQIALNRLNSDPQPLLTSEELTRERMPESFALSKSYIREEVLGQESGQKGVRLAYKYFILGENIDGMPQDNPHLIISRLELFQLYALQITHEYNCMGAAGKRVLIENDNRKYSGGNFQHRRYIA